MHFRIRIREQLCLVIGIVCTTAIVVLAACTWVESRRYLTASRRELLGTVANMKAYHIDQNIALWDDAVRTVSTRDDLQAAIGLYNDGNRSQEVVHILEDSLVNAFNGGSSNPLLLQASIFPPSATPSAFLSSIANATAKSVIGKILLPYTSTDGSSVYLGDANLGYPVALYPNLTNIEHTSSSALVVYDNKSIYYDSTVLIGPLVLNGNSSLISLTIAINNNTTRGDVLGWLTVVLNASTLYDTIQSRVGLGRTGEIVLVGPARQDNTFSTSIGNRTVDQIASREVQFVLPPQKSNHPSRASNSYSSFPAKDYPAVLKGYTSRGGNVFELGTMLATHNEEGKKIACGYAMVPSSIVDWVIVFEQAHSEVAAPMRDLRNTMLICGFVILAVVLLVCFPLAHYSVRPVVALRNATRNSITIYEAPTHPADSNYTNGPGGDQGKGLEASFSDEKNSTNVKENSLQQHAIRQFHIPEKVPISRHALDDELTELTSTFNGMVEELGIQYARLEERVRLRTTQLEQSRNAADRANASKTLFIANVSHEIRTPLNGIIGMCAVAMQEEEMPRVRQSLKIIYKSSDLLLHLLNDLLTFSSTSYGQNLTIENNAFRLDDLAHQIVSIFEQRAADANVSLRLVFIGADQPKTQAADRELTEDAIVGKTNDSERLQRVKTIEYAKGPAATGYLRLMVLRGDKYRILQVLMNLVSNSLKFTPSRGSIEIRIRFREQQTCVDKDQLPINVTVPELQVHRPSTVSQSENTNPSPVVLGQTMYFDFEVEDTGVGVPEHLQQEVFKPFVQADASLSKKHGGTGLGLAICAQLTQIMGGKLTLKSTVGIGSTFTLSLPLQYTTEKAASVAGSLVRPKSITSASLTSTLNAPDRSSRSLRSQNPRVGTRSGRTSTYSPDKDTNHAQSGLDNVAESTLPERDSQNKPPNPQSPSRRGLSSTEASGEAEFADSKTLRSNQKPIEPGQVHLNTSVASSSPRAKSSLTPNASKQTFQGKILVAEDNHVNQQVILRLLKIEGISNVVLAEDGEEALKAVELTLNNEIGTDSQTQPFSLIFMDVQMPKMDGIEATKKIRALGFEGPIVALTAYDHETNRQACQAAGMNGFLSKPIRRTVLKASLSEFTSDPVS